MAEVYEVATFYHHFEVFGEGEAPAAITVRVCDGLSCELAGARDLLARLPALARRRGQRGRRAVCRAVASRRRSRSCTSARCRAPMRMR